MTLPDFTYDILQSILLSKYPLGINITEYSPCEFGYEVDYEFEFVDDFTTGEKDWCSTTKTVFTSEIILYLEYAKTQTK